MEVLCRSTCATPALRRGASRTAPVWMSDRVCIAYITPSADEPCRLRRPADTHVWVPILRNSNCVPPSAVGAELILKRARQRQRRGTPQRDRPHRVGRVRWQRRNGRRKLHAEATSGFTADLATGDVTAEAAIVAGTSPEGRPPA